MGGEGGGGVRGQDGVTPYPCRSLQLVYLQLPKTWIPSLACHEGIHLTGSRCYCGLPFASTASTGCHEGSPELCKAGRKHHTVCRLLLAYPP